MAEVHRQNVHEHKLVRWGLPPEKIYLWDECSSGGLRESKKVFNPDECLPERFFLRDYQSPSMVLTILSVCWIHNALYFTHFRILEPFEIQREHVWGPQAISRRSLKRHGHRTSPLECGNKPKPLPHRSDEHKQLWRVDTAIWAVGQKTGECSQAPQRTEGGNCWAQKQLTLLLHECLSAVPDANNRA